jgi:hypothetical protein
MGDLISLDEYRERKQLEKQDHEWTDEQMSNLLLDILYLDAMGVDNSDISEAVMERIKDEAQEGREED